jgi:YspA, cpYpsA-related SLOG family
MFRKLDELAKQYDIEVVIEGEARGADTFAKQWATSRGIPFEPYPADWKGKGRSAGPQRNKQMLVEGKPDMVAVFLDRPMEASKGSRNMFETAKKANVPVEVYRSDG